MIIISNNLINFLVINEDKRLYYILLANSWINCQIDYSQIFEFLWLRIFKFLSKIHILNKNKNREKYFFKLIQVLNFALLCYLFFLMLTNNCFNKAKIDHPKEYFLKYGFNKQVIWDRFQVSKITQLLLTRQKINKFGCHVSLDFWIIFLIILLVKFNDILIIMICML